MGAKTQLPSREVRGKLNEYEREEQQLAKPRKHMAVLRNDHTCRSSNKQIQQQHNTQETLSHTLLDSWLTLSLHMDNHPKACATPNNGYRKWSSSTVQWSCKTIQWSSEQFNDSKSQFNDSKSQFNDTNMNSTESQHLNNVCCKIQ